MPLYPPEIDWLAWAAGIAGFLVGFKYMTEPVGTRRGLLKLFMLSLLGTGISLGGLGGLLANIHAPLINVTGTLKSVRHHTGKGASVDFTVLDGAGHETQLAAEKNLQLIHDGLLAAVRYQGSLQRALRVEILSGTSAGAVYELTDNKVGSVVVIAGGIILTLFGMGGWITDRNADDEQSTDSESPEGNIDEKSLLDLSGRG